MSPPRSRLWPRAVRIEEYGLRNHLPGTDTDKLGGLRAAVSLHFLVDGWRMGLPVSDLGCHTCSPSKGVPTAPPGGCWTASSSMEAGSLAVV